MKRAIDTAAVGTVLFVLTGCSGVQSALQPAGREAVDVHTLLLVASGTAALTTLLVLVLTAVALWGPQAWRRRLGSERVIVGGGIVFPVVVMTLLLGYGLVVLQAGSSRASWAEGPDIAVVGKRWWWKVVYTSDNGQEITSANELRLPVGRPVTLRLTTDDVIHSLWAPQLAGKLDMIPGRTNSLTIEATEPGISRGQCAEYCGGAHALMAFFVIALPAGEYDAWLAHEAGPAQEPESPVARRGQELFLQHGCGACHTVRGTPAAGTIGPDLTHIGSRRSLAAATLPNDVRSFARWISENQHIKPDNLMPAYQHLEQDELEAIAFYLEGLN